tara:strand:- start:5313 stop:5759 length:447 start_codon:yes stop_codon:yes gene_type:complete
MCHQAAIRSLVSIFVLLGITLFSVSSQAANCHESIQKTIDSDSIEHTVQYHISNKDFADISKCCEGNHLGTCCKICHSCKISSGTSFINEYTENKRDIRYQNGKFFYEDLNTEVLMREVPALKLQRLRHINTNISSANPPFKFRVLQV